MRVHALVIPPGILLLTLLTAFVGTGTLRHAKTSAREPARAFLDRLDAGAQERIRSPEIPGGSGTGPTVHAESPSPELPSERSATGGLLEDVLARSGYVASTAPIDVGAAAGAVRRRVVYGQFGPGPGCDGIDHWVGTTSESASSDCSMREVAPVWMR